MESLRGAVAIVGAADTEVGVVPHLSATQLYVKAAKLALEDAGITKDQVDGLITCNSFVEPYLYHAEMIAEYMQIFPRYCLNVATGGGTTLAIMHHAASAIATGICHTVLITMADNMLSGLSRDKAIEVMSTAGHAQFERPYGPPIPAFYALLAQAHMHAYGTTSEQFAAVAVACRKHAALNPAAQMRQPITIEDVLNSKMIAYPLHLLDCSLVSDGGAAIVMTAAERARDFRKKPVYILGVGEGHSHEHISQARSLTTSAAKEAGERAYAMAGVGPQDVDVAELYDCFTPVVIIELEDLGFCPKGEGGRFVEGGRIELGGVLPVNTHGGLMSHCHPGHPGSLFSVTEAVRQLRGECGPRQVDGAEIALVHGQGGIMSTHCTMILAKERS
ncbi:MAG: acetyl-CoA acetyltransferase [Candidatus Binatia bacterium]|nr:acetyl-CoA acetyltransferase [Candidatus Binatia bacterium]